MKIIVSLQVEPPRKSIDANELADFAEAAVRTLKLGQGKTARAKAGAGIGILITRSAAVQLSRIGMVARAAVLLMAGGFVLIAAWRHDARSARGLGGTLAALGQRPGGRWLLGLAAIGLFAYGLHDLLLAVFRRFRLIRAPRRRPAAG